LQLCLLVGRQFVLDPDCQLHVRVFDLALAVENLIELRQRHLLINGTGFHCFVQCFRRVLQLPLELVKARRGAIDFSAHVGLLLISQTQFSLVLHHHLRREHRVRKRVSRWWRWWLLLLWRSWLRWLLRLLCRNQHRTQKQGGAEYCD
jgi:hypothetical protein